MPDDLRELVNNRLQEWTILPPPLQEEFLDNERTLAYFTQLDPTKSALAMPESGEHPALTEDEQAHWNALSEIQRAQVTAQFNQFFELTPDEKQKTLNTLSDAERAADGKNLAVVRQAAARPARRMRQCVRKICEHGRAGSRRSF